jgi:hypothetical protein
MNINILLRNKKDIIHPTEGRITKGTIYSIIDWMFIIGRDGYIFWYQSSGGEWFERIINRKKK